MIIRNLILQKIEKIREKSDNFSRPGWDNFMIGGAHISKIEPIMFSTMQDVFLLSVYEEIVRHLTFYDAKPPELL